MGQNRQTQQSTNAKLTEKLYDGIPCKGLFSFLAGVRFSFASTTEFALQGEGDF